MQSTEATLQPERERKRETEGKHAETKECINPCQLVHFLKCKKKREGNVKSGTRETNELTSKIFSNA